MAKKNNSDISINVFGEIDCSQIDDSFFVALLDLIEKEIQAENNNSP